ncbi:MAG: 5'-nucleotidase C-terminal domain-containing protein [Acetobacteraceae bacterium]|nr:5'-nucleotidase C-terminal domain-containing protein [Acetobacteraceae bacterium]
MPERRITLLQINDTHGYLEPHPELLWDGDQASCEMLGGYARIAGLLTAVRAECRGAVVALDNGDTFHGTFPVVQSKGAALVPVLNALALDGMTAHWDFAYGPAHLQALAAELSYPVLANNCFDQATGELSFPPSRMVTRGGVRVGVIGIAATIVDKTMPAHFSTGIRLTLGRDELPGHIRALRAEGAEMIVVLSHLGFPQDVKLAHEVPGIDVLLSGHTHNRLYRPARVGETIIIQSGCHGSFVGRLDLAVSEGTVSMLEHRLIPLDARIPADPAMQELIEGILQPHRAMLDTVVGRTDILLHRNGMLETPMDDLLLAAIAEAAGTRLAFSNGWRYGAPIPPGPIRMNDLWNIIPTNPAVSTVELSGAELVAMLEENLERTFAADPYRQMGGFVKRCGGINAYIKIENPTGLRIERLFAEGEPVQPERHYTAAFVTAQGVPPKFGRNRRDLDIRAIEAIRRYLVDHAPGRSSLAAGSVTAV